MLIPAAISLILSTIFLNLSLLVPGAISLPGQPRPVKVGRIMGVSEAAGAAGVLVEQNDNLNQAVVKVLEQAKTIVLPQLKQLTRLNEPMRRLPPNQEAPAAMPAPDFDLPAANGVILDSQNDSLFFAKRPDRTWPIASITKLFTAYTFLDYNPGWDTGYEIAASDRREGGRIYLFTGDSVTVKDLFYFSLVGSDNTAAAALVSSTGLSEEEFVKKMNDKIKQLGFKNTRLADPVGLADGNISTAREVAEFARIALANPDISRALLTKQYEFTTRQGRKKAVTSTNELLNSFPQGDINILGGKTGYVNSSGFCLVSQFQNQAGQSIVTVILGADSDSSRFSLTKKLVDLYYKSNNN
ncbi:MAG: serine hydrolase [bacterium]|nr:serine hydrolase [bacterium]